MKGKNRKKQGAKKRKSLLLPAPASNPPFSATTFQWPSGSPQPISQSSTSSTMEVHHHGHVHEQKKWKEYLFQFLMLFLAVTLGFFAENQREHYIEGQRAKEYAAMLRQDLVNDTVQLKGFLDITDSMQKTYSFLQRIYSIPPNELTVGQLDSTSLLGFNLDIFRQNDAIYSLLKFSGNLRYIRDTAIISRLTNYENQVKTLKEAWNLTTTLYGGLNSEHLLQATVNGERFKREKKEINSNTLLKDAGYNFASWDENAMITKTNMNISLLIYEAFYPQLFRTAKELIALLNKKYDLEEH